MLQPPLVIPSTSKQYLAVPITGGSPSMPVEIAIIAPSAEEPATSDWKAAAWDDGSAKVLIGPGTDFELDDGRYRIWVRVTATPEIPVIRSGLLRIT